MIIYNKRLDIIADLEEWSFGYYSNSGLIRLINNKRKDQEFYYNSLEEFKKDWSDYLPKQPLIIDEHPRNAVKEWLTVNGGGDMVTIRFDEERSAWVFSNKHGNILELKDVSMLTYNFDKPFSEEELCGQDDDKYFKYMASHPELINM